MDIVSDRVQRVGFAEPYPPIQKQRVIRIRWPWGDGETGGMRQPIARSDHECFEGEPLIKRRLLDGRRRRRRWRHWCRGDDSGGFTGLSGARFSPTDLKLDHELRVAEFPCGLHHERQVMLAEPFTGEAIGHLDAETFPLNAE